MNIFGLKIFKEERDIIFLPTYLPTFLVTTVIPVFLVILVIQITLFYPIIPVTTVVKVILVILVIFSYLILSLFKMDALYILGSTVYISIYLLVFYCFSQFSTC